VLAWLVCAVNIIKCYTHLIGILRSYQVFQQFVLKQSFTYFFSMLHIVEFVSVGLNTEKQIAMYCSVQNKFMSRNMMKAVSLLLKAPYTHSLFLFCAVLLECFFIFTSRTLKSKFKTERKNLFKAAKFAFLPHLLPTVTCACIVYGV
jgi:hypothetical protein